MKAVVVPQMIIRVCGIILIILGVLFWTGNAPGLVPLHMLLGLILVIALWVLAGVAAANGVSVGLVALAAVWGLVVLALGLAQGGMLVGSAHWIVQVIHLLLGLGAIGLGEMLAGRVKRQSRVTRQEG